MTAPIPVLSRCRKCHRVLSNPLSITKGIGSTCEKRETPSIGKMKKRKGRKVAYDWRQLEMIFV